MHWKLHILVITTIIIAAARCFVNGREETGGDGNFLPWAVNLGNDVSGLVASSADSRGSWSCCANVSWIPAAHTDTSTTNSLSRKITQGQNHAHHLQWEQEGASSGRSGQVPHTDVANFVHFHCFSLKFVASCGAREAPSSFLVPWWHMAPQSDFWTVNVMSSWT